jgi:hypothetical protein
MTKNPENADDPQTTPLARGKDDRRGDVNPADNPMPSSPQADPEAVRRGQENLDSVTTK